jgi:hypothetical protein
MGRILAYPIFTFQPGRQMAGRGEAKRDSRYSAGRRSQLLHVAGRISNNLSPIILYVATLSTCPSGKSVAH